MKKVAIITITKNANFGNVLQNIAMQNVLKKLDCSPETIINRTGSEIFNETKNTLKKRVKRLLNYRGLKYQEKRNQIFKECCEKHIKYSSVYYDNGAFSGDLNYDFYIAGSDQIWNPNFGLATDFELLKFVPHHKKLSYAASFGISDLDDISEDKKEEIAAALCDFSDISVREKSGKKIIENFTDIPVYVNADPTMLLDAQEWKQYCEKPRFEVPEKYILVYMLGTITSEYKHKIHSLSKQCNAKIVNILNGKYQFSNPLQFIWMIQHAESVCTDSFHASVFSAIFHKQFYIFEKKDRYADQSSRFNSFLDICGIDKQSVSLELDKENINWEIVDKKIAEKRNQGLQYLQNHLHHAPLPVSSVEILQKENCCGCSACAQACPKKCIKMRSDTEGFLYPVVNRKNCINCGICQNVCPIANAKTKSETVSSAYAGYINNESVRLESSSGGLFTPLAEYVLNNNGIVFGAAFDHKQNVRHIKVDNIENLYILRGSKYVQSDVNNTYIEAKGYLDKGKKVLFTGTACQISGLKQYLRKDYPNLLTVDVLCHGTPSPKLLERYLKNQSEQYSSQIQQIFFRNKNYGWKKFAVKLEFSNSTAYIKQVRDDPFMKFFLGNICLRPSCHSCRFKSLERDSDLTIGDAWGINNVIPELDDDKGTSVILVHTDKGQKLLNDITDSLVIQKGNVDDLLPPSADSRKSVKVHPNRELFFKRLNEGKNCNELLLILDSSSSFTGKAKRKIKQIIRKVLDR